MKKILVAFLLLSSIARAQDNKPYQMLINGVKVIVVPSSNEIVQVNLVVKGGVQNYPEDKAGIEKLAITALTECGTMKRDRNSFKNALDEIDAQMNTVAGLDVAQVQLNCIKSDFETAWPLYVEALTQPRFDAKEFKRIKDDAVTHIREEESNPDAALQKMVMQIAFKGKDYSKSPGGTIQTIQKLTPEATKAYWKSTFTRSRIFLVVVGDIAKEDLQKKLTALVGQIPQGKPFNLKRDTYIPTQNSFASLQKDVATNYIMGISAAPDATSKDYYPSRLASWILYDKAFLEVRTNHGISYAPAAYFSNGLTPYSVMYVTTKEPNKYIAIIRNLIDQIKKEGFPEEDVRNMKITFATYQYYNNEDNRSLANLIAHTELLQGDWRKAFTLKDDIKLITTEEVNNVIKKYIDKFTWIYQGDTKAVDATLFTNAETPPIPEKKKAF